MEAGKRVYQVRWREGQPFIRHAKTVYATKAKKSLKAMLPSGELETIYSWHPTIVQALEDAILNAGFRYGSKAFMGKGWQESHPERPWSLVAVVLKLHRLTIKLIQHGIITPDDMKGRG